MPAYTIPPSAQSGVLILDPDGDAVDLTCFLKFVDLDDDGGTEYDDDTWCDPGAVGYSSAKETVAIEWKNSFTDGTDPGLYDVLLPYQGSTVPFAFQPYVAGAQGPKFEWDSYIPVVSIGKFQPDSPVTVDSVWGRANTVYTPAVVAAAASKGKK